MELVDIVMGTYNGEKYVEQQIESILANTYTDWKLWVCDDGSMDGTESIVRQYEQKYPDKIFWRPNKENKGAAINFLDGARRVHGEYVMFCDQDDYWHVHKIERTLLAMKKAEEEYGEDIPIAVYTDAQVVDEKLNILHHSFHKNERLDPSKVSLNFMLMENKMMGCTMMINRELANKLRVFPKKVRMHDWWAGLVAASLGKVIYLEEPTMLYRQHGKNVVGSSGFSFRTVKKKIATLKKQRQAIEETILQAGALYHLYKDEFSPWEKQCVAQFSSLLKDSWWKRRYKLLRYRFFKTGMIRNVGVFLLI